MTPCENVNFPEYPYKKDYPSTVMVTDGKMENFNNMVLNDYQRHEHAQCYLHGNLEYTGKCPKHKGTFHYPFLSVSNI